MTRSTIPAKMLTREEIRAGKLLTLELEPPPRPRVRADCVDGPRPCPWVGCRYNLYCDVLETGSLKLNFPDKDLEELEQTCALDVADQGGATLEMTGRAMNLTRERCRQIEAKMLVKLYRRFKAAGIDSAEGFLHVAHPLAAVQTEEGVPVQVGSGEVRRESRRLLGRELSALLHSSRRSRNSRSVNRPGCFVNKRPPKRPK